MSKPFSLTRSLSSGDRGRFAMAATGGFLLATAFAAGAVFAQGPASLTADLIDAQGEARGTATVSPLPSGGSLIVLTLSGLPEGAHGIHLHETGSCETPDFASAGSHITGEHEHGVGVAAGPHPGDLPNLHIPADGALTVEYFAPAVTSELLMDGDGSAIVIHADADDYVTQPTGNSGDRIACGVFAAD